MNALLPLSGSNIADGRDLAWLEMSAVVIGFVPGGAIVKGIVKSATKAKTDVTAELVNDATKVLRGSTATAVDEPKDGSQHSAPTTNRAPWFIELPLKHCVDVTPGQPVDTRTSRASPVQPKLRCLHALEAICRRIRGRTIVWKSFVDKLKKLLARYGFDGTRTNRAGTMRAN